MNGDFNNVGTKRGSEALISQRNPMSNGSMSPQPASQTNINNDAKKVKLDKNHSGKPSRVIHIGNLPQEITEAEIMHLGLPFGRVTNILVLKGKNQAFLEMNDEAAAAAMINYFTNCPAQLRGRNVFIQYSNHKELKTDTTRFNPIGLNKGEGLFQNMGSSALQGASAMAQTETQGGPNTILRVLVENMIFPVSLDVLHQIFSRIGKVLKIITFTKNNTYQALVQYPDSATAQTAKFSLDRQNIYNACCTLRIDFSNLTNLNVRYNNDKSRDYTNPRLPSGDADIGFGDADRGFGGGQGILPSPFSSMYGLETPLTGRSFTTFGDKSRGFLSGSTTALGTTGMRYPSSAQSTGCVLLVGNLNDMVTPDALFTLFGVYGNVQRVKILYNKKENALIQMAEPHQAKLSMTHLDRIKLYGRQIRVNPSKHQSIQMPREGQEDTNLTKDYSTSILHRFRRPGSKNSHNIYPPSSTLHLSNIPSSVSEDDIIEAFSDTGGHVKAFKFFQKDHKMALIEMGSVEEAVIALIKMHTYPLSDTSHLRVSFSKSAI